MITLLSTLLLDIEEPSQHLIQSSGSSPGGVHLVQEIAKNTEALCAFLYDHNDELVDVESAVIKVGRVTYPVVNVYAQYGATPGGVDATDDLQQALDVPEPPFLTDWMQDNLTETYGPSVLFFPRVAGQATYHYRQNLDVANADVALCGQGITLFAERPEVSSLRVDAENVHIHGFRMRGLPITQTTWPDRFSGPGSDAPSKFIADFPYSDAGASNASGFTLRSRNIVVSQTDSLGGVRGGFRLYGAEDVLLYENHIENTHSDAIHITHESRNITVRDNQVINSGDDCISVVPYNNVSIEGHSCGAVENVLIEGNQCLGSRARGLTSIGGRNVMIRSNLVEDVLNTGILVYPSDQFTEDPAEDISIVNNIVSNVGLAERNPHLSGIGLLGGQGNSIVNVLVQGNEIGQLGPEAHGSIRIKQTESCCQPGDRVSLLGNTAYGENPSISVDSGYANLYVQEVIVNGHAETGFGTISHATGATYEGVEPGQRGFIGDVRVLTFSGDAP